jgi:hypothetical protein
VRTRETNLGNLICDIILEVSKNKRLLGFHGAQT